MEYNIPVDLMNVCQKGPGYWSDLKGLSGKEPRKRFHHQAIINPLLPLLFLYSFSSALF